MYKDKERQRETTKLRVRRYREGRKALQGVTEIKESVVTPVILKGVIKTKRDVVRIVGGKLPYSLCEKCGVMNYRCVC